MTFGEKLQKLRAREGLSQDALAELLDVSRQAVSKWERDEAMPETEKVVRISNCFQVTTDYLLKDGPEKFPGDSGRRVPDLAAWYQRQGYLLGWIPAVWGAVRMARMLPALSLMADSWYTVVMMLLSQYLWPGLCLLAVGGLVLWRGRCLAGRLRWSHAGWVVLLWGALGLVRLALFGLLYRFPPENVSVSGEEGFSLWWGLYLALAVLGGAVAVLGGRGGKTE